MHEQHNYSGGSNTEQLNTKPFYIKSWGSDFERSVDQYINITSFLVFHTKVTVNIGLKEVVRMVTSIPIFK